VSEPVRLRPHHLVCLQFYRGEGYSAAFVENLSHILASVAETPALVVEGADSVCAACPGLAPDGTCLDPMAGEAEVRRLDRLALGVLGVHAGEECSLAHARELLEGDAVAAGRWRIEACAGCTWEDVCESGWDELLGEAEAQARASAPADDPPSDRR